MSHLKERKEQQCLNCNAIIYGRFCHICGQENVEPKEPFLHLLRHFIEDITHFDGKFFDTLRYLILRPGFLSYEYMRGRRNSYLNPIRMYVFTSALFFLVFFSVNGSHEKTDTKHEAPIVLETDASDKHTADTAHTKDTVKHGYTYKATENNFNKQSLQDSFALVKKKIENNIAKAKTPDAKKKLEDELKVVKTVEKTMLAVSTFIDYDDEPEDDTAAHVTNAKKPYVAVKKHINKQESNKLIDKLFGNREQISHSIPKVMFITLPLMALILQLFYRKLKQFYYVNHIIFILHLYVAVFLILLVGIGLDYFEAKTSWAIFSFFSSFVGMGTFFYTYKAMRNFYHQNRIKTFFKCFGLYFFFSFILGISLSLFNYIATLNAH